MTSKKIPPAGDKPAGGVEAETSMGRPVSAEECSTSGYRIQPPNSPDVLALHNAGVEFTLPNRGNKQPFTTGWPSYRPGLVTVADHLAAGHNLGVHAAGYDDAWTLGYFDADDGSGLAALLTLAPELADSLQSWRASGSGKLFFWVHDPDGQLGNQSTENLNGPHSKREFKKSGQAAIFGRHPSGQAYETNWAPPVTLTVDRVKAAWDAWTGQEWTIRQKREKADPGKGYTRDSGSDVEKVKAAWAPSAVFAHHWPGAELVKDRRGELRILGRGGLLCNDDDGIWHSFAENTGGDVFNAWAYATGRDVVRDFPAIIQDMAAAKGIALTPRPTRKDGEPAPATDTDTDTGRDCLAEFVERMQAAPAAGLAGDGGICGQIDRLRLRYRSVDFAGIVPEYHPTLTDKEGNPLRLRSITTYRTGDRDRVVTDAALGIFWEWGTLEARISNLELSTRIGYSPKTCGAAMRRLVAIFEPIDDGEGKTATRYKVSDALLSHTESTVLDVWESSALPLSTHRGHDVFVRNLSAMTPERLVEVDAKRLANKDAYELAFKAAETFEEKEAIDSSFRRRGLRLEPMQRNRQLAARLAAEADALGPAVLRLVDALHMSGALTGGGVAAVLHKSLTAARRVVRKAILAGLVVQNDDGAFVLAGEWSERVARLDAIVPTAGTMARRRLAAADSRLQYCEKALAGTVIPEHRESLRRRQAKAEEYKLDLIRVNLAAYNERAAAAGMAGVTVAQALEPGRGETFPDWQRRQTMDAQIDDLAIRKFAGTLAGLDRQTAEQTAYYAGYSNYEFGQAWALRAIV